MSKLEQQLPENSAGNDETTNTEPAAATASKPTQRNKLGKISEPEINLRFTSCGRCGLFISTFRLNHSQEFIVALDEIEADWLTLPWHFEMRDLVNKSYGCPIDVECYFFEGSCPECQRPFSYAGLDPDQPAIFLIKL